MGAQRRRRVTGRGDGGAAGYGAGRRRGGGFRGAEAVTTIRSVEKSTVRRCGDQRLAEPGPDQDAGGGTSLGIGPFGALRPVWHTAAGFLVGVVWAVVLILPGWLLSPHGQEQRAVAAVYQALADQLAAIGTDGYIARRQAVTSAIGEACDELLTARTTAPGRNPRVMRLVAALNASNLVSQAVTTLGVAKAGRRRWLSRRWRGWPTRSGPGEKGPHRR